MSAVVSSLNDKNYFTTTNNFPKDEKAFFEFFDMKQHTKRNGDTSITIFFIIKTTTSHTLNKMKQQPEFFNYLKERSIYTFEHPFQTKSLARIGFFCGLANRYIQTDDFYDAIHTKLTTTTETSPDNHFVPLFAINTNVTRHRQTINGKIQLHSTEALEIECDPKDIESLTQLMFNTELDKDQFGEFIPYTIHANDPELLIQKIADNNYHKTTIATIYLHGIHPDVMHDNLEDTFTVKSALLSNPEIFSVERNNMSETHGKWTVITSHELQNIALATINDILTPVRELETYKTHVNDNKDYEAGMSVSKFKQAPIDFSSQHLKNIRNTTNFLPPEANNKYIRATVAPKQRNPLGTITFTQSPPTITPTNTNAWTNGTTSINAVRRTTDPNNPFINHIQNRVIIPTNPHQLISNNNSVASNNNSVASQGTDNTVISNLIRNVEQLNKRVAELSTQQNVQSSKDMAKLQDDMEYVKKMLELMLSRDKSVRSGISSRSGNSKPPPPEIQIEVVTTNVQPPINTHSAPSSINTMNTTTNILPPTDTHHDPSNINTLTATAQNPNSSQENITNISQHHFSNLPKIPQSIINRAIKMGNYGIPYSSVTQIGKAIQNLGSSHTQNIHHSPTRRNSNATIAPPHSPESDMSVQIFPRSQKRRTINTSDDDSEHTPLIGHLNDATHDSLDDISLPSTQYDTSPPDELQSPNVSVILSDAAPDITVDLSLEELMDGTHHCPEDTEMSSGQLG